MLTKTSEVSQKISVGTKNIFQSQTRQGSSLLFDEMSVSGSEQIQNGQQERENADERQINFVAGIS